MAKAARLGHVTLVRSRFCILCSKSETRDASAALGAWDYRLSFVVVSSSCRQVTVRLDVLHAKAAELRAGFDHRESASVPETCKWAG